MLRIWSPVKPDASLANPTVGFMQSPEATFDPVQVAKTNDKWCTKDICLSCDNNVLTFEHASTSEKIFAESSRHVEAYTDFRGMQSYRISQSWLLDPKAGLYGGGGYQNGMINYRNTPVNMVQFNVEAVVPFFVSTAGFGLLWHNYGQTHLNPCDEDIQWKDDVMKYIAKHDGVHEINLFMNPYPSWGGVPYNMTVNGELISETVGNTPNEISQRYEMKSGQTYEISVSPGNWGGVEGFHRKPSLCVRYPDHPDFSLTSEASDDGAIDYYLMFGESIDKNILGYRDLTGHAPMYAKWAYGFWQCKEHYATQDQVLQAAKGYRDRKIPMDNIVQDWLYWGKLGWGPHWDFEKYPDPAKMVQTLHDEHAQLMVSVWGRFDNITEFYNEMKLHGYIINDSIYYDAWNPAARALYYNFINTSMFSIGVDGIWLDATEPEHFANYNHSIHLGSGNVYLNSFSLFTTQALYEGFTKDYPDRRLFILTRSSFAGQQRYVGAVWTGDIISTWDVLRRQIVYSINFALSGMPYWSQDIGGFFRPHDQYTSPDYHEMLTRWFQFGAFTPIYRVHGGGSNTEIWNYGNATQANILVTHKLRYRLFPYIYSLGFWTTLEGYTMQRHLVFDFAEDPNVHSISDQYMFGPAFLVAPISQPGGKRTLYLPNTTGGWCEFFSGRRIQSGTVQTSLSLQELPLYVRAGSIVPMADVKEWWNQPGDTPLSVRIYPGSDGQFTLYDDDGVSRDYEKGKYTSVAFSWDNTKQEITIKSEVKLTLNLVLVDGSHGAGVAIAKPDATAEINGVSCINMKDGSPCHSSALRLY